jgi:hypothetical protein
MGLRCCVLATVVAFGAGGTAATVGAQENERSYFTVPFEFEGDYGAANGNALFMRIMPLWQNPVREKWRLTHLDLITLAQAPPLPGNPIAPEPVPGSGTVTGLSDLLHVTVWEPRHNGAFTWGVGTVLSIPTATDPALGSGKWAAGPAARVVYRTEHWSLGAVFGQRWSYAGDSDRAEVSSFILRGAIRRPMHNGWYFVSAPIINANWNRSSGNRWLVPVGGGFGKAFKINRHPWAFSVQAYYNAARPEGAPEWSLRLGFVGHVPQALAERAQ